MSKKSNRIIGIAIALFTLVAIFVLFSAAFGDFDKDAPSTFGNVFQVIFGKKRSDGTVLYNAVGGLIAAFVLYLVSLLLGFIGIGASGKGGAIVFGLAAIGLIVGGILFLMTPSLFIGANPTAYQGGTLTLGVGPIVTSIFAFLAGVIALYGAYKNFKD